METKKEEAKKEEPKKDGAKKEEPKKDLLAELDLPGLIEKREKAVAKQKEANTRVETANADHLVSFWIGGGVMLVAAIVIARRLPEYDPLRMLLVPICGLAWIGMWIVAFLPSGKRRQLQEEASAATRQVRELDNKIAFCHQVFEEAKKVKVRKYAEAWAEKPS